VLKSIEGGKERGRKRKKGKKDKEREKREEKEREGKKESRVPPPLQYYFDNWLWPKLSVQSVFLELPRMFLMRLL